MIAAINDLSFEKTFQSKEEAVQKLHQWLDVCRKIEAQETTAIAKLYSAEINTSAEIAPGYPLIQMVREFQTKDERRYLIHLLSNLGKPDHLGEIPFQLGDSSSYICAWAKDGFLISLETDWIFKQPIIEGELGTEKVPIKNLSGQEHIQLYEELLGIRHFEPNKKHRKESYIDAAGRYVSAMDLNDEEAQKLLNGAVEIDGKLYGKQNGRYYCFQKHHDNYYHLY